MLNAIVAANLVSDLGDGACTVLLGTEKAGRGEPGGLVVDRDRDVRPGVTFDAGVVGGSIPLASALLETL